MDVLSLSKASKALRDINQLDTVVVAPEAESYFPTVDARLDWIEDQASKIKRESVVQVDLSQGVFTDTEYVNGRVQLKDLGDTEVIENINVSLNKSVTVSDTFVHATPIVVPDGTAPWIAPKGTTHWLIIDLQEPYPVNMIKIANCNSTDSIFGTRYSVSGSNDNTNWTLIGSISGLINMKGDLVDIVPSNIDSYQYIKVHNMGMNNTLYYGGRIDEIQVISRGRIYSYSSTGTWESPVIDLGEGWTETSLINIEKQIQEAITDCVMETASSTDGLSFSGYELFNSDTPTQARYLKIRATLTAEASDAEPEEFIFNGSEGLTSVVLGDYAEQESVSDDLHLASIKVYPLSTATSTPSLDSIKITYDELTIEGRLKELERLNAINFAKLQFKTSALMQADKYKMHDLVVDTFESDSMTSFSESGTEVISKTFTITDAQADHTIQKLTGLNGKNIKKITLK